MLPNKLLSLLVITLLAFACKSRTKQEPPKITDSAKSALIGQLNTLSHELDSLKRIMGKQVSSISFATPISLDSPGDGLKSLEAPDELVIPWPKVRLVIDYPVRSPVIFELTTPNNGFTRKQIILAISQKFHQMYAEEEKTARTKTTPMDKRQSLINRNETDGKYGIWGHDLADLQLSTIDVYQNAQGEIYLELDIES